MKRVDVEKVLVETGFLPTGIKEKGYDVYESAICSAYLGAAFVEVDTQAIAFPYKHDSRARKTNLREFLTMSSGWDFKSNR